MTAADLHLRPPRAAFGRTGRWGIGWRLGFGGHRCAPVGRLTKCLRTNRAFSMEAIRYATEKDIPTRATAPTAYNGRAGIAADGREEREHGRCSLCRARARLDASLRSSEEPVPVCGRIILAADPAELVNHFGLEQPPNLVARYNIAPSQLIAVVAPKADPTKRGLALLKWGLVPISRP